MSFFTRTRTTGTAVAAAFAVTVLLAGCASGDDATPSSTQPTSSAPTEGTAAESTFETFTTTDGAFTFDHPARWTVTATQPADATPGNVNWRIEITTEDGAQVAALQTSPGVGVPCERTPSTVLATEDLDLPYDPAQSFEGGSVAPQFRFQVIENNGALESTIGITSIPAEAGSCNLEIGFFLPGEGYGPENMIIFGTAPFGVEGESIVPTFATMDEARDFMNTDDYKDLHRMFLSFSSNAK